MIDKSDFRARAHEIVDWMADYLENVEDGRVTPETKAGDVLRLLPKEAPQAAESFEQIFADFQNIIMPNMTHWEHPNFHAYFNSNKSDASIWAEMLTTALGAQCMSWQTSPAATELEERVMDWLIKLLGFNSSFAGVIQDTASTATLCSILSARERYSAYKINEDGFYSQNERFLCYCSREAHSSIEKAIKIAGLGKNNIRFIDVDENYAMIAQKLDEQIAADKAAGYIPLYVVAAVGTTGSVAIDPLSEIAAITKKHKLWLHVDAAYAGTAAICPEFQWMLKGQNDVDSFVFNPHKWMFTNFDCSVYIVKDKGELIRTFEILPEYLKTKEGDTVNNYRDWGIQLGRRFRALKLWFVLRHMGVSGIQEKIRFHIELTQKLKTWIDADSRFEILAPVSLNVICFRLKTKGASQEEANALNMRFLAAMNANGKIFLTHTKLNGKTVVRFVLGATQTEESHVKFAWNKIVAAANTLEK